MLGCRLCRTTRYGVTLIELLLALVLFAVGASALAGGMRTATRSFAMGRAFSSGAFAAESRLELLRARCTFTAGAATLGAVEESWVAGGAAGTMLPSTVVVDSITLTMTGGVSTRVIQSIVRCTP
jgi:prepilin-type N-terminal cleavage/methylation domain-containing protein